MIRLGYACINTTIDAKVNSTCILKTFKDKGVDYVIELARNNLKSVLKILEWNEANNIRLYRLSSSMLPHVTNMKLLKNEKYVYSLDLFQDLLTLIGDYAKKHNHRLTFHPDHFNQIGTNNPTVLESTILDLSYHADILDMMNLDDNSVMVVHGGGTYKNKTETMNRWVDQYIKLPENVKRRLVLENCENSYSIEDTLLMSNMIKQRTGRAIPCVFDTHHHLCYPGELFVDEYYINDILQTWYENNLIPKFHISEQAPNKRIGAHSDYVENIPDYFFYLSKYGQIDLMIEAKAKDKAVLYLKRKYNI